MSRARMIGLSIAMFLVVIGIVAARARAQAPAPAAPKKAEEQFKNIQMLKGIPADQLFPTMQFITASLGVECEYCHVQGAFEKDDKKPKQTARKMMEMMFAINKDNFEGHREVTCYSCHRGSTDPAGTPVINSEAPKGMAAGNGKGEGEKHEAGPSAEQLLDKYVRAAGGQAAIEKITTRVAKGAIEFGGKSFPIDIYSKDPDQRISFTHLPEGDNVTAFNGSEGWLGTPGRPLREMNGSDRDGASIDADLHLAVHLHGMFSKMEVQGTEKVGEHETYVVVGRREGKPPIRLYFDQQSGLLVRLVRFGETALGRLPTQIDYADYRDADGVKVPFRWTLARTNGEFTIQANEMTQNVPIDDAKFVKPPAPAEQPKGPGQ